jgi:tetratricopeptide (TPR) repeat protein
MGRWEEAETHVRKALEINIHARGEYHRETGNCLNTLAAIRHNLGNSSEARALYRWALDIREHVMGADHPDVQVNRRNLAELYIEQGRYDLARPLLNNPQNATGDSVIVV